MSDRSEAIEAEVEEGSGITEAEIEEAEKEFNKLFPALMELQNDLLDLHERAIHVRPSIWNLRKSRRELTDLQEEYAELSEDVKYAIKVGHTPSEFEKSDRFDGDLSGKAAMVLSVNKFNPVIEKHVDRIADRSQRVEAVLANRSRDITNRFALAISLVAILISTVSILIQST